MQPGVKGIVVPRVSPAVQVLIEAKGKKKAKKAIKFIEKLQDNRDPQKVSDAEYRIYNTELIGKNPTVPEILGKASTKS